MKFKYCQFTDKVRTTDFSSHAKYHDAIQVDNALRAALESFAHDRERRSAFRELVAMVRARTPWLKPVGHQGSGGWKSPVFLLNRLRQLTERQNFWLRSPETWHPAANSLREDFRSLARHLLGHYAVPGFMDAVWDLPSGAEAFRQQSWSIRLARGRSFRELNLPLALTRNMEHFVRQSPDHYTVVQALRFGEIRGLGGSLALTRELLNGRLGRSLEEPQFWRTVLLFLINHSEINLRHVNPIIEFLHAQKFALQPAWTTAGPQTRPAPQPQFAIKGRTLKSLLRLMEACKGGQGDAGKPARFSWPPSGIEPYRFVENSTDAQGEYDWSFHELLDSEALRNEGQAMRHCIYTYVKYCRRGEAAIWSLRLRINGEEKRMVTIDVDPRKKRILQMRAKCNLQAGGRSREIIRQWAERSGLTL